MVYGSVTVLSWKRIPIRLISLGVTWRPGMTGKFTSTLNMDFNAESNCRYRQSFTDGGKRNGNHAMIYSAKFHHTMFAHQYTGLGKNNCATTVSEMFRNNDFYWPAANNLQPGTNIPRNWNWGKAASNPQALASSVCGYHPF